MVCQHVLPATVSSKVGLKKNKYNVSLDKCFAIESG